jgi:chitodextrinase
MTIVDKAIYLRSVIENLSSALPDDEALNAVELFPKWNGYSTEYSVGDRVRYEDILYKCLQSHTSQEAWTPIDAPSLWARVLIPDPDVIPEWIQPDSTNPYMRGDKVTHNGKTWESLIDNNVWEPGAIGTESLWKEVTE